MNIQPTLRNLTIVIAILGETAATLVKGYLTSGQHKVGWHVQNLPSGVYIYRLRFESFVQQKQLMLLK
jgi:hypothetical protein